MKVLDRSTIASGGWISLQKITYEGHDGKIRTWESASRVNSMGAVMMIPVTKPNGDLVVIRQFRPPTGRLVYEFPAGLINPGEDPVTAAIRSFAGVRQWDSAIEAATRMREGVALADIIKASEEEAFILIEDKSENHIGNTRFAIRSDGVLLLSKYGQPYQLYQGKSAGK